MQVKITVWENTIIEYNTNPDWNNTEDEKESSTEGESVEKLITKRKSIFLIS